MSINHYLSWNYTKQLVWPLLEILEKEKTTELVFNIQRFTLLFSIIVHSSISILILSACNYEITCDSSVPSFEYITSFSVHNRLACVILTAISFFIVVLSIYNYSTMEKFIPKGDNLSMLLVGLFSAFVLPFLSIASQIDPSGTNSSEKIHVILKSCFISLGLLYFSCAIYFQSFLPEKTKRTRKPLYLFTSALFLSFCLSWTSPKSYEYDYISLSLSLYLPVFLVWNGGRGQMKLSLLTSRKELSVLS